MRRRQDHRIVPRITPVAVRGFADPAISLGGHLPSHTTGRQALGRFRHGGHPVPDDG